MRKRLSLFASLALAWAIMPLAHADTPDKNIVFEIDGTLFQGIPSNAVAHYDPSTLIQIDGHSFRVADHAADAIRKLATEPGVKISFVSELPKALTTQILAAISAMNPKAPDLSSLASKILTREDLVALKADDKDQDDWIGPAPKVDLTKISKDLKNVVLIDDNSKAVIDGQSSNLFYYHHPLYQYESFADAQKSFDEMKDKKSKYFDEDKKYFPADESEWKQHQQRMALIYDVLEQSLAKVNANPKLDFGQTVNEVAKASPDTLITAGLADLDTHLEWKIVSKKVAGCIEKSNTGDRVVRTVRIDACAMQLPVTYSWGGAKGNTCTTATTDGAPIGPVAPDLCIKNLPVHYLWTEKELKRCGIFTDKFVYVQDAPSGMCDDPDLFCRVNDGVLTKILRDTAGKVLYEIVPNTPQDKEKALEGSCGEKSVPITADSSPQKKYFQNLLKRGMSAPIDDFLKLWYPNRKLPDGEPYFFKCQSQPWGDLVPNGPNLSADCSPQVLYSWGPAEKLTTMKQKMPDDGKWQGTPNVSTLFTTMSPVSTFSYGTIQVRIKIKDGTPFRLVTFGGGGAGAVGYRQGTYQDFALDDSSVIESWSVGTPEQYDETVRDILRLASGERAQSYEFGDPGVGGMGRVERGWDGHDGSEDVLKANLLEMIREILSGEGRIYYASGVCRNRAKTFRTARPNYVEP